MVTVMLKKKKETFCDTSNKLQY